MVRGMRWVVGVVVLATGCSVFGAKPPPVVEGTQVGVASWYGPGFHGKRAANGEIFDQYELTAAHNTLPLGSHAVVTNLSNGRAVEVRITDRGPFVGARIIDLSYAAARVIDMIGPGTATVRIDVLAPAQGMAAAPRLPGKQVASREMTPLPLPVAPPATRPVSRASAPAPPPRPTRQWTVQVAAFGDPAKADHLRRVLSTRFTDVSVDPVDTSARRFYRVAVGPYADRADAVARAERITRLGYPTVLSESPLP